LRDHVNPVSRTETNREEKSRKAGVEKEGDAVHQGDRKNGALLMQEAVTAKIEISQIRFGGAGSG